MGRRPIVGAAVFAGLVAGVLVATIIYSGPGHRPSVLEWTVQLVILAGAVLIIADRVRRKG